MVVAVVEVDHVVLQTWAAGSRAMVELPGLAPSAGASSGCAPRAVVSPDSQQDRETQICSSAPALRRFTWGYGHRRELDGGLSMGLVVDVMVGRSPWHASIFGLADGEVVRGPAAIDDPCCEVMGDDRCVFPDQAPDRPLS